MAEQHERAGDMLHIPAAGNFAAIRIDAITDEPGAWLLTLGHGAGSRSGTISAKQAAAISAFLAPATPEDARRRAYAEIALERIYQAETIGAIKPILRDLVRKVFGGY